MNFEEGFLNLVFTEAGIAPYDIRGLESAIRRALSGIDGWQLHMDRKRVHLRSQILGSGKLLEILGGLEGLEDDYPDICVNWELGARYYPSPSLGTYQSAASLMRGLIGCDGSGKIGKIQGDGTCQLRKARAPKYWQVDPVMEHELAFLALEAKEYPLAQVLPCIRKVDACVPDFLGRASSQTGQTKIPPPSSLGLMEGGSYQETPVL
jgi:hypothetical protein